MMGLVSSNMEKGQSRQKWLYDRGAHSQKLEAGNTLHANVGNTLTSTHITGGDVSVQTWGTTLKSTKISTTFYLCSKPTRSPRTFTQPMAANYMWAVQCIRRAKVQLRPLQICPLLPHMWGISSCLYVPCVSAFRGN